jgi:NADH dehydrogenase
MPTTPKIPRVYIIGGGFAGLNAARALRHAPVEVTLVDRRNHHLFQPLLYQVATAALSPADIAIPIRRILRNQKNTRVVLAEIKGVDLDKRLLEFEGGAVEYDYLILATGATHSYFGHPEWEKVAPGLKSIEDATTLRKRILLAFESAEYEGSDERRKAALTFAIVGGGPTGVELAGAIREIAMETMPRDFHYIDTTTTRVILLQGDKRILPTFPEDLSARAQKDLERLGVEVRTNARVTNITREGVNIGDEFLPVRNVFWAAGVQASPIGKTLGTPVDKSGRVIVNETLNPPNHPEVFVCGDLAAMTDAKTHRPIPGVAQGAIQSGEYAGHLIASETLGKTTPAQRKPFTYWDKGSLATIGKAKAVADIGKFHLGGLIAWLMWGVVHVMFLVGWRNKIFVFFSWLWNWLLDTRDARLITGEARIDIQTPRPGEVILFHQSQAEAGQPDAPPVMSSPARAIPIGAQLIMGEPKT